MRKPTLKRVRNWTPTGSPRPVVRLVTPLPAFTDEPPTVPAMRSDIRELRPTSVDVEEETLVRIPSSPPPPSLPPTMPRRRAEPSRDDESLGALVGTYVEKTSRPPPPADDTDVYDLEPPTDPEPGPPPTLSERRVIAQPKRPEPAVARVNARGAFFLAAITITLALDAAVKATEEWLGSLDTKQRVVFIATSALVASVLTFLAR